jgi:hypothetical protein
VRTVSPHVGRMKLTLSQKRKRPDPTDDYDYKDPFIDDSDLQMDEVMIMHRPAKEGFYVQKGAVELWESVSFIRPKIPKRTDPGFALYFLSSSAASLSNSAAYADDADDYMDGTGRRTKKKLRDLMTNATASSSTAGLCSPASAIHVIIGIISIVVIAFRRIPA